MTTNRARQFQLELSGFAPPHLRLTARFLLRRFPLRRGLPRRVATRLRLARLLPTRLDLSRLIARGQHLRPLGPRVVGPVGPVGLNRLGTARLSAAIGPDAVTSATALPTVVVATVVWAIALTRLSLTGAIAAVAHIGRGNAADATNIATGDPAASIVVHGPLALACDEPIPVGLVATPILEDEARLCPVRQPVDDAAAAVVPVRIVPGIVIHDDAEPDAGVVIRIPVRVAHIRVAVVAQEPWITVLLLDVIRDDVVVPVDIPFGHDALGEVGHGDVWIAADATIGDRAVVPVVPALDGIVGEGNSRGDREEISDA